MILFGLAYLGGVLTILSPCILPVLPFVFARADRPFVRSGLPMLVGMALTFALVATLAAVGGGWAVSANEYGRWIALVLLALFAVTLLFPALADRMTRPLVALGGKLTSDNAEESSIGQSLILGVATGLLWAPCAGPILGLILTAAALQGASADTALLLVTYAAGAATSLGIALFAGRKVFVALNRSQAVEEWIRRVLGVAVLVGVACVAFGLDRGLLTKLSGPATGKLESSLIAKLDPALMQPAQAPATIGSVLPDLGPAPSLDGAVTWLNSPPLTMAQLKGKVVVVDFWTYSCINCLRSLPYVKAWAQAYAGQGLVVIGVHTPEFAFEKVPANVAKAVKDLGVTYPVAVDSNWTIWKAFKNNYWPAHYFIDATGRIRYEHFGEGEYDQSEMVIRKLLAERNGRPVGGTLAKVAGTGAMAQADWAAARSHETYVGSDKAAGFAGTPAIEAGKTADFTPAAAIPIDHWAFAGAWRETPEAAVVAKPGARILYRFQGRDLHMVLGPASDGHAVKFRILIDGKPPGADHGVDVDANGDGVITSQRLYQLVRQSKATNGRLFEIQFEEPGAEAFTFTFG
jgi:cytochrome c biogenesis protein CcdA/thiol-disulfide isomerase/thioredoxin